MCVVIRDYQAEVLRLFQDPRYLLSSMEIDASTEPSVTVMFFYPAHVGRKFSGSNMWRSAYRFIMLIYNNIIKDLT